MRIRQKANNLVGISNNTNWHNTNQEKMRINKQTRNTKNTKTTQIIHGMHTSPNKIYTPISRNV